MVLNRPGARPIFPRKYFLRSDSNAFVVPENYERGRVILEIASLPFCIAH